jgi:hypothetical protein
MFRFHTTLRLHQRASRISWYSKWHDFRYAHHVHVAVLVGYIIALGVFLGANYYISPGKAFAANGNFSQTTFNGTSDGTYSSTQAANSNADLSLQGGGSQTYSNNGSGGYWPYKRPITVTNSSGGALTDYQVQVTPFTDSAFLNNTGLYASYHMNENAGTLVGDSSGNSYNKVFSTGTPTWSSGKYGYSLNFSGAQSVGLGTFDPAVQGGSFSVSTWINTTQSGGGASLGPGIFFAKRNGTNTFALSMNGGKVEVSDWGAVVGATYVGTTTVNNGAWHHVALTWDGTTSKLYIDGVLDTTKVIGFVSQVISNGNSLGAFDSGSTRAYTGSLDEVLAFNRALTATEVSSRYGTAGVPKVRSDYQDLRFTSSDGATEYPYWQESDGRYWVKIPGTLATGATTINMVYGNTDAATSFSTTAQCASAPSVGVSGYANCGKNVFLAYSDVNDLASWTGGGVTAVGNELYVNKLGTAGTATKPVNITGDWVIETKYRRVTSTGSNLYIIIGNGVASTIAAQRNSQVYVDSASTNWNSYNNGAVSTMYTGNAINNYYISKEVRHSTVYDHYLFDPTRTQLGLASMGTTFGYGGSADPILGVQIAAGSSGWTTQVYIPWLFARKYASTEPTAAAPGNEVSGFVASGSYLSAVITATGLYGNWGILTYTTTLNGQTLTVDVLKGSDNSLISSNVSSGANLALSTATYPSLKLRANFSGNGTETPYLNDWSIAYSYDIAAPTVPVSVTVSSLTSSAATLTWPSSTDADSGVSGYQVQRATEVSGIPGTWVTPGGTCAGTVTPASPNVSCSDSGLTANTKYYYRVRAFDAIPNYSAYSGGADATGGAITYTDSSGLNPRNTSPYVGGYVVHTFTSGGNFTTTNTTSADTLVVAGGGGGGTDGGRGGGGGAGGLLTATQNISGTMVATVGGAGTGSVASTSNSGPGGNSSFGTLTTIGGGRGGGRAGTINGADAGGNGGSGGGGDAYYTGAGGTGTAGQGYAGGVGATNPYYGAGGGGGAGGIGGSGSLNNGGAGGAGISSSLSGTSTCYAGGGGGGYTGTAGAVTCGGGTGGAVTGVNATANTGGGGGGAGTTAGNGATGIVIIRYPYVAPTSTTTLSVSAPTGLALTTLSTNSIRVDWSANSDSGLTGYKIERSTSVGGNPSTWVQVKDSVGTATTWTDDSSNNPGNSPLTNTKYFYRIRAYTSGGNSVYSSGTSGSLTLQPDGTTGVDSNLISRAPTNTGGSGTVFNIGDENASFDEEWRGLVKFDLSTVPAGAAISSATYSMFEYAAANTGTSNSWPVGLKRVLRNWDETNASWNKYDVTNSWTTAGATADGLDRVATSSATQMMDGVAASAMVNWTGDLLNADIQQYIDGTTPNYGWLIQGAPNQGVVPIAYNNFYTSDHTTSTVRPKLVLNYTLPLSATTFPVAPVLNTPATPTNDNRPAISNSATPDASLASSIFNLYEGATKVASTRANASGVATYGTNKLVNPSFETDTTPANGIADGWEMAAVTAAVPTMSIVDSPLYSGEKAQRITYSSANDTTKSFSFRQLTDDGSYYEGGSATNSVYLSGSAVGATVQLQVRARNSANVSTGDYGTAVTLTGAPQLVKISNANLPAGTARIYFNLSVSAIDTGDTVDITMDAAKTDDYGTVLTDGAHTLFAKSVNSSLVESVASTTKNIFIDTVKPNTSISSAPSTADGLSSWFKTNPTISLATSDAAPSGGNGAVYYKWDDATLASPSTYSSPIDMNVSIGQGVHTLYWRAIDQAGNSEVIKSQEFKLDTSAPAGATVTIGSGGSYITGNVSSITLTGADLVSGMSALGLSNDGTTFCSADFATTIWWDFSGTLSDPANKLYGGGCGQGYGVDGSSTIYVRFGDNAGNVTTVSALSILDTTNPTNPTATVAASPSVPVNSWYQTSNPVFTLSGASDATSGVTGYYAYFGTNAAASPLVDGVYQNEQMANTFSPTLVAVDSGKTYYLRVQSVDTAGNIYRNNSDETVYTIFTYRYDVTNPAAISYITPSPAGWSATNNFSFSWPKASDIDSNGASSGVKGYIYRRKTAADADTYESWDSVNRFVTQPNGTMVNLANIQALYTGANVLQVRAVDNTGNESVTIPVNYSYTGDIPAPSPVTIDPSRSQNYTVNNFSFSWYAPSGITPQGYYWSVNASPNEHNSIYIPYDPGVPQTSTGFAAFATQAGVNRFYVVTKVNDIVGWSNPSTAAEFQCNTIAPGVPTNILITDSSARDSERWQLTVNWDQPTQITTDFNGYSIERSTDGTTFKEIATVAKQTDGTIPTGYLDTGLLNAPTYYYRVLAKDNTGVKSATSSVVSRQPTGRYTEPPKMIGEPKIEVQATKAIVTFTTERDSDSFIQVGATTSYGMTQGQLDSTSSHEVTLSGLTPGMFYHYRAMWRDIDSNIGYSKDYTFRTQDAPGISEVSVSSIGLYSALVSWKTNTVSSSVVKYGKTNTYGSEVEDRSGSGVTVHVVKIEGLTDATTYHFKIAGTDTDGNGLNSDDYSFETLTFPRVSDVKITQKTDEATSTVVVSWNTNVPTDSVVNYSGGGVSKESSKALLEQKHSITVTNLRDNTAYAISVGGRDAYGNQADSSSASYKTAFDTRPPQISAVTTEVSVVGYGADAKGQVIVSWETDEPGTSQVQYGVGVSGDDYSQTTQEDSGLTTTHVVVISGLKSSTSYHFQVVSKDASTNKAVSEDSSFLTDQASSSVLDIIVNSLQSTIGWIFSSFTRS